MSYGMTQCDNTLSAKLGGIRMPTLRQRLEEKLKYSRATVEKTEEALKLLDENPMFEKIQNAMTDLGM